MEEKGTVISYNSKGFAFIRGDNGQRYFASISSFPDRRPPPETGERVAFEEEIDVDGRHERAVNVRYIYESN